MLVLLLPALLKVAVSSTLGKGDALQLTELVQYSFHREDVVLVPFHVPLAACAVAAPNSAAAIPMSDILRQAIFCFILTLVLYRPLLIRTTTKPNHLCDQLTGKPAMN